MQIELSPSDINSLLDELKSTRTFSIDTTHYLQLYELVNSVQKERHDTPQVSQWSTLIAPIICKDAEEQAAFYSFFKRWSNNTCASNADSATPVSQVGNDNAKQLNAPQNPSYGTKWLKILAVIFVLTIGSVMYADNFTLNDYTDLLNTNKSNNTNSDEGKKGSGDVDIVVIFVAICLLTVLLMLNDRKKKSWLRRESTDSSLETKFLKLASDDNGLFTEEIYRTRFQRLRKHIVVNTASIDAAKTVEAASQNYGLINPVYTERKISPEYLVLIDLDGGGEHSLEIARAFAHKMKQQKLFVKHFYFYNDPRFCFTSLTREGETSLKALAASYISSRLIVISKGDGLINLRRLSPHAWVHKIFSSWKFKAYISPLVESDWDIQEQILQKEFSLFSAGSYGLERLTQFFEACESYEDSQQHVFERTALEFDDTMPTRAPIPPSLLDDPIKWIINKQPDDARDVEQLIADLQEYLGEFSFKWLCACALFPKLVWEISNYLYDFLAVESQPKEEKQELFYRLSMLVWFEQGYIPNYLRVRLMLELTDEQKNHVTEALYSLLNTELEDEKTSKAIEFGIPLDDERKKLIKQHIGEHHNNNKLFDGLVVRMLNDEKPNTTDFELPEKVAEFVSKEKTKVDSQGSKSSRFIDKLKSSSLLKVFLVIASLSTFGAALIAVEPYFTQSFFDIWTLFMSPGLNAAALVLVSTILLFWSRALGGDKTALKRLHLGSEASGAFIKRSMFVPLFVITLTFLTFFIDNIATESIEINTTLESVVGLPVTADLFNFISPTIHEQFVSSSNMMTVTYWQYFNGFTSSNILIGILLIWYALPIHDPRQVSNVVVSSATSGDKLDFGALFGVTSLFRLLFICALIYLFSSGINASLTETSNFLHPGFGDSSVWIYERLAVMLFFIGISVVLISQLKITTDWLFNSELAIKTGLGFTAGLSVSIALVGLVFQVFESIFLTFFESNYIELGPFLAGIGQASIQWLTMFIGCFVFFSVLQGRGIIKASILTSNKSMLIQGYIVAVCLNIAFYYYATDEILLNISNSISWIISIVLFSIVFLKSVEIKGRLNWGNIFWQRPVHTFFNITIYPALFFICIVIVIFLVDSNTTSVTLSLVNQDQINSILITTSYFALCVSYVLVLLKPYVTYKEPTIGTGLNKVDHLLVVLCFFSVSVYIDGIPQFGYLDFQLLIIPLFYYFAAKEKSITAQFMSTLYIISIVSSVYYLTDKIDFTITLDTAYLFIAHAVYCLRAGAIDLSKFVTAQSINAKFIIFICFIMPFGLSLGSDIGENYQIYLSLNFEYLYPFLFFILGLTKVTRLLLGCLPIFLTLLVYGYKSSEMESDWIVFSFYTMDSSLWILVTSGCSLFLGHLIKVTFSENQKQSTIKLQTSHQTKAFLDTRTIFTVSCLVFATMVLLGKRITMDLTPSEDEFEYYSLLLLGFLSLLALVIGMFGNKKAIVYYVVCIVLNIIVGIAFMSATYDAAPILTSVLVFTIIGSKLRFIEPALPQTMNQQIPGKTTFKQKSYKDSLEYFEYYANKQWLIVFLTIVWVGAYIIYSNSLIKLLA